MPLLTEDLWRQMFCEAVDRADFYRRIGGHDLARAVLDDQDILYRTFIRLGPPLRFAVGRQFEKSTGNPMPLLVPPAALLALGGPLGEKSQRESLAFLGNTE